jgi:Bacterial antitoxin of type II TA system, VapB
MTTSLTTDLQLDPALCEQARQLGGHTTLTETLQTALEAYVGHLQPQTISEFPPEAIFEEFGKVDYYEDYDYKQLRKLR